MRIRARGNVVGILVVDDAPGLAYLIQKMLEREGHRSVLPGLSRTHLTRCNRKASTC
ncbi:MAG: CheY-like chemotaxis protein [Planctomycetota bacterium]|jgi:CheY-like chemotaxis protein